MNDKTGFSRFYHSYIKTPSSLMGNMHMLYMTCTNTIVLFGAMCLFGLADPHDTRIGLEDHEGVLNLRLPK